MSNEIETEALRQQLKETQALAESRLQELVAERVSHAASKTQLAAVSDELAGIKKHDSSTAASQLYQIESIVQPARGERLVDAVEKRLRQHGCASGVRIDQHEKLKVALAQAEGQLEQVRKRLGAEPGVQTAAALDKRLHTIYAPVYSVTLLDGSAFYLEHGKVLGVPDYGALGQLTIELVDGVKVTAKVSDTERPWLLRWCDAQAGWARYKKLKAERTSAPEVSAAIDSDKAKLAAYRAAWNAHTDSQHLHGVRAVYNFGRGSHGDLPPPLTVDPTAFAATFHDAVQESLGIEDKLMKFASLPAATRDCLRLAAVKALNASGVPVKEVPAVDRGYFFGIALRRADKGQPVMVLLEPKVRLVPVRQTYVQELHSYRPPAVTFDSPPCRHTSKAPISPSRLVDVRRFSPALSRNVPAPAQRYVASRPEDVAPGEVVVRWFESKQDADNFAAYCRTMTPAAAVQEIRKQRELLGAKAPGAATRNSNQPWCVVDLRPRFVAKLPVDVTDRDRVVAQGLSESGAKEQARLRNDGAPFGRSRAAVTVTGNWCVVDTQQQAEAPLTVPPPTTAPAASNRYQIRETTGPDLGRLEADVGAGKVKVLARYRHEVNARKACQVLNTGGDGYFLASSSNARFAVVDTQPPVEATALPPPAARYQVREFTSSAAPGARDIANSAVIWFDTAERAQSAADALNRGIHTTRNYDPTRGSRDRFAVVDTQPRYKAVSTSDPAKFEERMRGSIVGWFKDFEAAQGAAIQINYGDRGTLGRRTRLVNDTCAVIDNTIQPGTVAGR
jgi:hypothetical protein